jgi:hypothetical protein
LSVDFGYRKKFMLVLTIASYIEKNTNSKIGVQGAMLVGTNKTIIVRRLRMSPTKRAKKRQRWKRKIATLDQDIEGSKERKVPALVIWYLHMIICLNCMFSNPRDPELLLWHVNHKTDGKIRHPTDGKQWKQFDLDHQEDISNDPRNIRFGLSMDGMNPFGETRNPHNIWPVIMWIFNLPPWLCHKRKYLLLKTLISGPKQVDNDIGDF